MSIAEQRPASACSALAARQRFIEYLIWEFDLNECEAGDLGAFLEVLSFERLVEGDLRVQLGLRAEVLSLVGSEMQGMYDVLEQAGREHRAEGGTFAG